MSLILNIKFQSYSHTLHNEQGAYYTEHFPICWSMFDSWWAKRNNRCEKNEKKSGLKLIWKRKVDKSFSQGKYQKIHGLIPTGNRCYLYPKAEQAHMGCVCLPACLLFPFSMLVYSSHQRYLILTFRPHLLFMQNFCCGIFTW